MERKVRMIKGNRLVLIFFLVSFMLFNSKAIQEDTNTRMHGAPENINQIDVQEIQAGYQKSLELNQLVQTLDKDFINDFVGHYHVQNSRLLKAFNDETMASQLDLNNIKSQPGNYLLLLSKIYLYDILPKSQLTGFTWTTYQSDSRFLLAYFYLKIAAQKYQNAQAYYYLAVLDYYKINPHQTFIKNLEKQIQRISTQEGYDKVYELRYNQLLDYLKNQRFYSVEQNLFLSSMMGNHGASLTLGYMYKMGIGLDKNYKNCTTALSYYLSVIKESYVDIYEFRNSYPDEKNFEKELYTKRKVVFENDQNVDVVSSSEFFDSETIKAMYQLAENYFIGRNGFSKNYEKAAQLYGKLAAQDHKNSMAMLGMCYFKGQGVPIDRKRARVLFQHSTKVSISEAMIIVMDYFEIQSKGNRAVAIKKMKEIYSKKKDNMNSILKYLLATLVIKGDLTDMKTDDAILLLGGAAKDGHLMAKIAMGLLFADGIDVSFDCSRAVNYFSEEALSHPFFMEKYYLAKQGLKKQYQTFSLIKYLQLTMVGHTNSFINALYILEIEKEAGLSMNQNSWSLKDAAENPLYQKLKKNQIVPDIYSYFQRQYTFLDQKPIKFSILERLFQGNVQVLKQHEEYIKKKVIKVCAVTKENSLMNFYEYQTSEHKSPSILEMVSNGQAEKLHVLQSRYLLGQYLHKKSFQTLQKGKDNTKQQYRAMQEYKRATNSQIIGKILFYIEQINLNPFPVNFQDQLFQFAFINDLLTYTFILSILLFVLYYKRSKKLDEIHKKQLEKREEERRIQKQEEEFKRNFSQSEPQSSQNIKSSQIINQRQKEPNNEQFFEDRNQPYIEQQRPMKGYRIGSSQEDDPLVLRQAYEYEQYKFQEEKTDKNQYDICIQNEKEEKEKVQ